MKFCGYTAAVLMLCMTTAAEARRIPHWSYEDLLRKADLVVIADAKAAPRDTKNTDNFLPEFMVQMEIT